SNGKPLADAACRFEHQARWQDAQANKDDWRPDRAFAAYQTINFVPDSSGTTYMFGFATDATGHNVVDLFALDVSQPPDRLLRKVGSRTLSLSAGNLFRYSGGAWLDGGRLAILASPQDLQASTKISIHTAEGERGK